MTLYDRKFKWTFMHTLETSDYYAISYTHMITHIIVEYNQSQRASLYKISRSTLASWRRVVTWPWLKPVAEINRWWDLWGSSRYSRRRISSRSSLRESWPWPLTFFFEFFFFTRKDDEVWWASLWGKTGEEILFGRRRALDGLVKCSDQSIRRQVVNMIPYDISWITHLLLLVVGLVGWNELLRHRFSWSLCFR